MCSVRDFTLVQVVGFQCCAPVFTCARPVEMRKKEEKSHAQELEMRDVHLHDSDN